MCLPRRVILHFVPPVAMATRHVGCHKLFGTGNPLKGKPRWARTCLACQALMTMGAGGEPGRCSGVSLASEHLDLDHGAVVREAPNKKGIRYSQDANAGVAFQPAVTVSGALARIPCVQNTSLTIVRQEKIRAAGVRRRTGARCPPK